MKLSLVIIAVLMSFTAQAELRIGPNTSADSKLIEMHFDIKTLNELNDLSAQSTQEEIDQNWRSFLSSGHFTTEITKEVKNSTFRAILYSPYNFGSDAVKIEGSLNPGLLKSIVRTYWEDLQTFTRLAPGKIVGSSKEEIEKNANRVYSCVIQMSQMTEPDAACANVQSLTTLSKEEFELVSSTYVRIMRSGTLNFEHQYCEVYQDQELNQTQKAMTKQMWIFSNWITDSNGGLFSNPFNARKIASMPFFFPRMSKFNGPKFKLCRSNQSMHLSYVGNP